MPDLPIRYAHAWDRMEKGIDEQGPYYAVRYKFDDWADSDDVANLMRGYTVRVGGATVRTLPHAHPLSQNLSCASVAIEGLGSPVLNAQGLPDYDGGFYAHAVYRPLLWLPFNDPQNLNQIDPDNPITTWCTQELDFETEVIPHDESNQYTFTAGDPTTATGIPVQEQVQITTLVLTFHQVPYLPLSVIRAKRNKINSSTFLGADPEKVRFINARTTIDYATDGTTSQKVQMIFKERDVSWNKLLKKDGTWAYVYRSDSSTLFATTDLTPLVQL